ncbi:OmpA family protein [Flavobacteriaceae bacterium Ap0902]|nr:OmpA family protein [Flavobacteriaceae bacterium Ap0902]
MFYKYFFLFHVWLFIGSLSAQSLESKYPDIIYDAYYSGLNPKFDSFYGGVSSQYPISVDPERLLEDNDAWFISLPKGSFIVYQYTNNAIFNAPDQDDIIIIENGCCRLERKSKNPERAKVYVSGDGVNYSFLGIVDDCEKSTLDLETISFDEVVRFIKIEGLDYKCNPEGFDLKNAYALPGANIDLYMGINHANEFFNNQIENRILILDHVYFSNDSYAISHEGQRDLNIIIQNLNKHPDVNIHLVGHTDNNASESYNLHLSIKRANAVQAYLLNNGIDPQRVSIEGRGETEPLKPNTTESGRAINRRVELRRLN